MSKDQVKFLFVGLGNIGCQAVHKAVTTVAEAYSPSVRGLLLDTARASIESFSPSPLLKSVYLDTLKGTRAIQLRSQSKVLDSWLPNFPMTLEPGSGLFGNKALGRLALIINIVQVATTFKEQVKELIAQTDSDCELQVIICCSLGGGTGSAHIDLAYLLRAQLESLQIKHKLIALLPYSKQLPEAETTAANIYAGLIELNHWMDSSTLHKFACDLDEVNLWEIPEDESKANKRDESTAEILAKLDIYLAENVRNVNPGLGKEQKEGAEAQDESATQQKVDSKIALKESCVSAYDLIIFNSLEKFNDDVEFQTLSHALVRLAYWYFEVPNLYDRLFQSLTATVSQDESSTLAINSTEETNESDNHNYADLHSYQVARPTQKILSVARNLSSQAVISELYNLFFEKDLEQDSVRGLEMGKEFIKARSLDSLEVHQRYTKCWQQLENGLYDAASFIEKKLTEVRQNPIYGDELVAYCRTFDAELQKLADKCETQPDFFAALAKTTKDISDDFVVGIDNVISDTVNRQHNGIAMQSMIDEVNKQLSFSLSALHERTNNAKSEMIRLEEQKNKAIESLAAFKPSIWQRMMRKVDFAPLEEARKVITEYYNNVFVSYVGREEVNAFFNMINVCESTTKRLHKLRQFLDDSTSALKSSNRHLYKQILEDADEPLISSQEAVSYIASHASPPDLMLFVKALDQLTDFNLLDLPTSYSLPDWLSALRKVVAELYPMHDPKTADEFLKSYPEDKLDKKLTAIGHGIASQFVYATPFNLPNDSAQRQVLVSFDTCVNLDGSSATDKQSRQQAEYLQQAIQKARFSVPGVVIDEPQSETLDFVELTNGFTLADLEISEYKDAYLESLIRGSRAMQSRKDVKLKSLLKVDKRTHFNVVLLLASAFKFGVLQEREDPNSYDKELRLTSNKWMDLTSIRACLKVFADPVEALLFENNFYQELLKWRQQQMNSMGMNAWLKAMAPDAWGGEPFVNRPESCFSSLDLDKQMLTLQDLMSRDLERHWPSWKYKIAEYLNKGLDLKAAIAKTVQPSVAEWLEMRWNKEHTL